MATLTLCAGVVARGQDAATEERLNQMKGKIDDVIAAQESLRKQILDLSRDVRELREQAGKPTGNYAGAEDLKRVAKAVEEVDRKRVEDAEKVRVELNRLRDALLKAPTTPHAKPPPDNPGGDTPKPQANQQGYEYIIKEGETLSSIIQAYREKNIKVTLESIKKANPGLKEDKVRAGQKIFIPAPQP